MVYDIKPKKRSKLRLFLGKKYFTYKRILSWYFGSEKFAKVRDEKCKYLYKRHSTPIYRKLKDVDMWIQENKKTNLSIALKKIDEVVILPGETFSFWKLVGKTTRRKGYVDGMILSHGKFMTGLGGGMCQLTNLLFWLAVHTPLTITERYRHSYDVFPDSNRTQPFGSGATCLYNYRDLKLKNETIFNFKLKIKIENDYLVGEIYSSHKPAYTYEVYEKEHCFVPEYWGGYTRHNSIYRKVYDDNSNEIYDEFIVENHAICMYSPFLENSSS